MQSFAAHDHSASVRCVALSGNFLASGGADDRIFIYDLKSRKQQCALTHHNSTITCLQFTENHSHLISGSSDGVLAIVRVGNWQLEKIWEKGHKGLAVLDIAVHNSGKLALSLGADCTLCTWNLIKGRQAYVINLNNKCKNAKSLEKILWAPDGVRFLLYGGKFTEIWSIETGGVLKQIEHNEKVTGCVWLNDEVLLVGHENGEISVLNLEDSSTEVFKAHESRVKGISLYKKRVITISSGGEIKIWNRDFEELGMIDTGCRLTCLCVVPPIKVKNEEEATNQGENVAEKNSAEVRENKKVSRPQVIEEIEEEVIEVVENKKNKRQLQGQDKKKKKKRKISSVVT